MEIQDRVIGKGIWQVDKYRIGESEPYETLTAENIWLTTGWTEILDIIAGNSTDHFDNTYAMIGVGTDATAADAAQTDLIGASTKYKNMESGSPTSASAGTIQYRAKFLSSEGNFAWNEMVLRNGTGTCWNRNATGWGTKDATEVWTVTLTLGKS
jgi:hypothetical protein